MNSEFVNASLDAGLAEESLHSPPGIDAVNTPPEGVRFERVLVPVDLSGGTLSVLRRASALASPGTVIRVLHAVQLNIVGEERGIARTDLIRELHEAARKELSKLIESLWADETSAAVIIREGRPKDVILQEACSGNADLVVMGAHPHGGWRRRAAPQHGGVCHETRTLSRSGGANLTQSQVLVAFSEAQSRISTSGCSVPKPIRR